MKYFTQKDLCSLEHIREMERTQDSFDAKILCIPILTKLLPILNQKLIDNDFDIVNRPTILGMWCYRKGMQCYFAIPFDYIKMLNSLSNKGISTIVQKEIPDYDITCSFDMLLAQLSITLFPKV